MARTFFWVSAAATLALAVSCSVVNAPDDVQPPTSTTSAGGGSGGGTGGQAADGGTGGTGGTGGSGGCGDGTIDTSAGETCDPPTSCPDCDDGDECTTDTTQGSADTCDVVCDNTAITECLTVADGCCLTTCDGLNDPDCAVCDNGTVELGETCDPPTSCPTSCAIDADLCTGDELTGSAQSCDAECSHPAVTQCSATSDACCPSGCTASNDPDCDQSVLLVHNSSSALDVKTKLTATGLFAAVDDLNVSTTTPTLAALQPYDVVMAFSGGPFADSVTIGDVLADYYDGGGRVVTATFSTCANASLAITGRFGTLANGYELLAGLSQAQPADSLGTIAEPNHMLMTGVSALSAARAFRCPGTPANGGVVVAQWGNGDPLMVRGTVQGRPRVYLNFYPASSDENADWWVGDGVALIRNALLLQ